MPTTPRSRVEHMSEEELLKGLEGLAPPEEQPEPDDANNRSSNTKFANGPASGPFSF